MKRMRQWADFILEAVRFRATSGNHVTRISELGEDGIAIVWERASTIKDEKEFIAWARTKLPANTNFHEHAAGTIVEKIASESTDMHRDGARGLVLNHLPHNQLSEAPHEYGYFVQWEDFPFAPVFICGCRLREVKG